MWRDISRMLALCLLLAFSGSNVGHGLIEDAPSRNWFCGSITRPDHAANGVAPLVITAANTAADAWPTALAQAVNTTNGAVRIGVVNAQNQVVPQPRVTVNRVYALTVANITSTFLQRVPGAVPMTLGGLTAAAGNAQVQLNWNAFAVQSGGTGTVHPTSGDTYTLTYTSGGVQRTQSGTF